MKSKLARFWWPVLLAVCLAMSVRSCRHIDDGDPALHVVVRWGSENTWGDVMLVAAVTLALGFELAKLRRSS